LQFGKAVPGLSINDITLTDTDNTGIRLQAGGLTDKGGDAYALAVSGVAKGGAVTVKVAKAGYAFSPPSRTAAVRYGEPVTAEFLSLTEDGYATGRTTALTLTFDRVIGGLTAGDITLTDTGGTGIRLRAGGFTHLGGIYAPGAYRLEVSGITKSGEVTARVSKAGYAFSPDTQSAQVYGKPVPAAFVSLAQIDEGSAGTKALALTFDQVIPGLSADDITLIDTGNTGIRFRAGGIVTQPGGRYPPETYFLAVTGVTKDGTVTVKVRKTGWAFEPDTQSAQVLWTKPEIEFRSLSATEDETATTTMLTLIFDQVIPGGLTAADIALTDNGYTGIRKGALTDKGGGEYRLAVSGVTKFGTATVNVSKAGYAFIPHSRTVDVSATTVVVFQSLRIFPLTGTVPPTRLVLKFDKVIEGLSAGDITLEDTGHIGIRKGALTDKGDGEYWLEFGIQNIRHNGYVTAKVSKWGYAFTPDTRRVWMPGW
jgi:hypothetical protein